jgi:hypothetical protein
MPVLATGPHVEAPVPIAEPIRRFTVADLTLHGLWMIKRLLKAYPQQTDRSIAGWLRSLDGNDSLFLATDSAVGLFQVTKLNSLAAKPVVLERFVFAMEGHETEAVEFYGEAERWAKTMGVEEIIVEAMTDVPHEMIKEKLGRLYIRQQTFART